MAESALDDVVEVTEPIDPDTMDALHALPLAIMPLKTPGLRKSAMIKNARLDSVIEMFRDGSSGSGQIEPNAVTDFYQDTSELREDLGVLGAIGNLQSFDVYSLRIELRNLNIGFSDFDCLKLSPKKQTELNAFMRTFTRPLIARVFGSENQDVTDVGEIIQMLAQPDRQAAIKQLQRLADELNVTIMEVPSFIEHYGDIFLSLSYYRNCFDETMRHIPNFLVWMDELRDNHQVRGDRAQNKMLDDIENGMNEITTSVTGRFSFFTTISRDFWSDISAESFREFRDTVTAHHVSIGAVLCGLSVKMKLWKERFRQGNGGPSKRLEFLQSEIHPGLEHIRRIEKSVGAVKAG
jgi:hypothetical protein